MSPLRSWLSLAALLFAVAVSASVQWETLPSLYVPWMPAFWGVAALIGAVAWRLSSGAVQTDIAADKQRVEPTLRTPVVGAALLCLSAGLIMLFRDLLSGVGTALWAIGCAGLPAAFAWAERAARQKASRPRTTRSNWRFALLVVLAVALAVRLYQLDDIPTKYLDDEGAVSDWGLSYLHGTPVIGQNTAAPLTLFRNGTTAYPLLGSVVHALVMQVAGETIFGSRLTAVLAGVACVAFLYALLLEEVPQWAALATAFLFAFCHTHLFWSRSGIPQSLTTATIAGFFWLTLRGLRNGSYAAITTAGLLLGLAQYFYEGARFFAFVLIAFLLITAALEKNFVRRRWLHLALMAMMSALVFAPIGFWYLQNPNELLARSSGVFIFAHPDYIASRYPGLDTTGVILAQLRRAFEGFAYRGDGSDFFSLRGPILDPVARTLLITGIFATIALRDRLRLLTALWIWIPIAIVCVPTVDPPSMTRLIQVVPALYVVVGLVLARIGRVMWSAAGRPGAVLLFFAIAAAFAYAVDWNLSEFFVRYPAQQVADAQTVGAKLIAQAKPDDVIRILSGFSFYAPSVRFLAHGRAGEDLPHNAIPLPGRLGHDSLVIVSSNATEQIESLRATYPDAVEAEHRNSRGDLLLHSFRISAASMNAAAGADAAWRLPDASIGMRGNRLGEFAYPRAIAADGNGRLYVADTKNQRIEVFDAHGNGLFEFGG